MTNLTRRTAAFIADLLLLHFVGLLVGVAFSNQLMLLGSNGYLVGLVIAAVYFSFFESALSATPGKFVLGLRVSSGSGRRPNLGQGALRTIIVFSPWLLSEYVDLGGLGPSIDQVLAILRTFLVLLILTYPFFNGGALFHDFASGSYVTQLKETQGAKKRDIPTPFYLLSMLSISAILVVSYNFRFAQASSQCTEYKPDELVKLLPSNNSISNKKVSCANYDPFDSSGKLTLYATEHILDLKFDMKKQVSEMASRLYAGGLRLRSSDRIYLWCSNGYDIGLYSNRIEEGKFISSSEFNSKSF